MAGEGRRPEELYPVLGHRFAQPELLEEALTHPSAGRGRAGARRNYERMEFVGDRVLALVMAHLLYDRYPREMEGDLARRHAELVRRDTLAGVAAEMGLADYIIMSKGEAAAGGRDNPAIRADCCEAVIAALFFDGGLAAAERFIRERWAAPVEETARPPKDAKTALQEWAQARGLPLPDYRTVAAEGLDHRPVFSVEVRVEGLPPAAGRGASKRAAEQAAAETLFDRAREHG